MGLGHLLVVRGKLHVRARLMESADVNIRDGFYEQSHEKMKVYMPIPLSVIMY